MRSDRAGYIISIPSLLLAALLLVHFCSNSVHVAEAIELDIHLKLEQPSCLYETALEANQNLHHKSSTEQISFTGGKAFPHVTLYLTHFQDDKMDELMQRLKSLNQRLPEQRIKIDGVHVNSAYAMYHALSTESLQLLSDTIVESTMDFIEPHQPVPEWVYNLPDPARSKKIAYVEKYGSPNVFDQFDAHITVGYDDNTIVGGTSTVVTADDISKIDSTAAQREQILLDTLDSPQACDFDTILAIGVGAVGEYGTVVNEMITIRLIPAASKVEHSVVTEVD